MSVTMMLRTLRMDGRIGPEVKACTVRRMLAAQGLTRVPPVDGDGAKMRLRWQAERPGALWHGDVCHGATLSPEPNRRVPVRVHALLDDASRFVVALRVGSNEREETMLSLFAQALMEHGIEPASVEDTAEYLRFRLRAAGADRDLFPDDALAVLHELSQGALREIDRLATAALREAARRKI